MKNNFKKVEQFYLGKLRTPELLSINNILKFSRIRFELQHHFIQWLFPISTISHYNLFAPTLTKEESLLLGQNVEIKNKMIEVLHFVCQKYELDIIEKEIVLITPSEKFSGWWIRKKNHNYLRLTRILICLNNFGLKNYSKGLFSCLEQLYQKYPNKISEKTMNYWIETQK